MIATRDNKGRWISGNSGNPEGRPEGAKDKKRRYRFDGSRNWPCEKNLGNYAVTGGPGRPCGSRNRSVDEIREQVKEMKTVIDEGRELSIPALLRFARSVFIVERVK